MSFAGVFDAIAARYGQVVTVAKDGVTLGSGRAVCCGRCWTESPSSSPRT